MIILLIIGILLIAIGIYDAINSKKHIKNIVTGKIIDVKTTENRNAQNFLDMTIYTLIVEAVINGEYKTFNVLSPQKYEVNQDIQINVINDNTAALVTKQQREPVKNRLIFILTGVVLIAVYTIISLIKSDLMKQIQWNYNNAVDEKYLKYIFYLLPLFFIGIGTKILIKAIKTQKNMSNGIFKKVKCKITEIIAEKSYSDGRNQTFYRPIYIYNGQKYKSDIASNPCKKKIGDIREVWLDNNEKIAHEKYTGIWTILAGAVFFIAGIGTLYYFIIAI